MMGKSQTGEMEIRKISLCTVFLRIDFSLMSFSWLLQLQWFQTVPREAPYHLWAFGLEVQSSLQSGLLFLLEACVLVFMLQAPCLLSASGHEYKIYWLWQQNQIKRLFFPSRCPHTLVHCPFSSAQATVLEATW